MSTSQPIPIADAPANSPDQLSNTDARSMGALGAAQKSRPLSTQDWHCVRAAQTKWQTLRTEDRSRCIGRLPGLIAQNQLELANAIARPGVSTGELLSSELLPFAEACRYLARHASATLKARRLPKRDNPWWLGGVTVTELYEPWGCVLIVAPSNYPLLLPGVQFVQALVAGNAVLVKPAPGCERAMNVLSSLIQQAGVPGDLIKILDTAPESVHGAIAGGVDKVVVTGSRTTGRSIAAHLAQHGIPSAMELSGNDALIVTDQADLERVSAAVAYSLSLNGGQTCIAPRRLMATAKTIERLLPLLGQSLAQTPTRSTSARAVVIARAKIQQALSEGASVAIGSTEGLSDPSQVRPIVLAHVKPNMSIANEDVFAPVMSIMEVRDIQQAIEICNTCPYGLGASVFGQEFEANRIAQSLSVGCVTINDILVPTADPRVSFSGRRSSGYGVTRGLHGLKEMTQLKVVCERNGKWLPHLSTSPDQLEPMMQGILKLRHGQTLAERWSGLKSIISAIRK